MNKKVFIAILPVLLMTTTVMAATPNLGTAGNFVILSKSGITDVPTSVIKGNIGTSPITGAAIGVKCAEVTGTIYDDDHAYTGGGGGSTACLVTSATLLTTAVSDMETAYTNLAGQAPTHPNNLNGGNLGGLSLTPGVYKWTSGVTIPTDVTLNCEGNPNAVFIFQIAGTLGISSGKQVILSGNCQAANIFWQVAGATTLGTYSVFNGNILDKTNIAIQTGATLNGRALAQTAVTLDSDSISLPAAVPTTVPACENSASIKLVQKDPSTWTIVPGASGTFSYWSDTSFNTVKTCTTKTRNDCNMQKVCTTQSMPYCDWEKVSKTWKLVCTQQPYQFCTYKQVCTPVTYQDCDYPKVKVVTTEFDFDGKKLVPGTQYTLISYKEPRSTWPAPGNVVLGTGTADSKGNVDIDGIMPALVYNTYPTPTSTEYSGQTGAKIWLVLSSDMSGTTLQGWNPMQYLFESALIPVTC